MSGMPRSDVSTSDTSLSAGHPEDGHPLPGQPPYTRGIHEEMYKTKLWTMRQYAGYSTAQQTNERFRLLLDEGQTGLSVAFDLPTQLGLDSDHPNALGEVGKVGVAIDSIRDMRVLFNSIDLDSVSTSMTINAPATTPCYPPPPHDPLPTCSFSPSPTPHPLHPIPCPPSPAPSPLLPLPCSQSPTPNPLLPIP